MRQRHVSPHLITVEPWSDKSAETDELGDHRALVAADSPFTVIAQIDHSTREMAAPGNPGKNITRNAMFIVNKSDIARSLRPDWEPKANDAITTVEGDRLYITHVRGTNPIPARMGRSGGWTSYAISVSDSQPANVT